MRFQRWRMRMATGSKQDDFAPIKGMMPRLGPTCQRAELIFENCANTPGLRVPDDWCDVCRARYARREAAK